MEPHGFLQQALVYLAAGVIAVPLCKRLGLGSVLGYLVAGMAIGPWGLRLIADPQTVLQFSEFGVVLLLSSSAWSSTRSASGRCGARSSASAACRSWRPSRRSRASASRSGCLSPSPR